MTSVRAWSLLPLGLAVVELAHPTTTGESVSETVRGAGAWWLPLHIVLLSGYALLVAMLWRLSRSPLAHASLAGFAACNSLYLAVDGMAVGILAQANPSVADGLWSAAWVNLLADVTGATWAASLLLLSLTVDRWNERPMRLGASVTWLAFVASAVPGIAGVAVSLSRIAAAATGGWSVYQRGTRGIPIALLIFASVMRQHVGAEAAFGLVLLAIATGRSSPAAASPP